MLDGTCGVLSALSVIDGFLRSRAIDLGLVVASDARPARGVRFPYARTGGAMLLERDADGGGFTAFATESFPDDGYRAEIAWHGRRGLRRGRNVLEIDIADGFTDRCVGHSEAAARRFLDRAGLGTSAVGLLVAAHDDPSFGPRLSERLGIGRFVGPDGLPGAHTAATIAALRSATDESRLASTGTALVVAAGAGIRVALALYRTEQVFGATRLPNGSRRCTERPA